MMEVKIDNSVDKDRQKLVRAYTAAGREFLAYRLTQVFAKIETAEHIALHNDVIREIAMMTEGKATELLKEIADKILIHAQIERT